MRQCALTSLFASLTRSACAAIAAPAALTGLTGFKALTALTTLTALSAHTVLTGCAAPRGSITSSGSHADTQADVTPAAAPKPARTVDAIPKDPARKAFDSLPATRAAGKTFTASTRPTALPSMQASQPAPVPAPVAVAAPVPPVDDGTVTTVVVEGEPKAAETLPAPSIPGRRANEGVGTPGADENDVLRGELKVVPPQPVTPPVAPAPKPAPTPAPEPAPAPAPVSPAPPVQPIVPPQPIEPPAPEPIVPPVEPPAEPAPTPTTPPAAPAAPAAPAPPAVPAAPTVATIHRPALATRVSAFAEVTALDPAVVAAGGRVIVYFELAGWQSPAREDGQFVTEATYAIQVLDETGHPVWSDVPQRAKDVSRTVRTDLYVTRLIALPATLPPGKYAMRIVANDTANGAQPVAMLPFEITAEPVK